MPNTKKQKNQTTPDLLSNRLMLRVQEFADLTGTPVPTVYKYLADGEIPAIRLGGTVRIPVSAITDVLRGNKA